MSNQNIAIGIDLGTVNSKIAVNVEGKIEIIKKPGGVEYTPSVFGFDKSCNKVVGQKAYDHLYKFNEKGDGENFKAEIKRVMGTSETVYFPRAKIKMTPEEISAEILKGLKEDLLRKYSEFDTTAVVITVPATLSILQSEATKRAGNLAGFKHVVLLQEPLAAAISYGFMNAKDENWLIYDFGGGTFDLAVVSCKEGMLSVLAHGGEGYLGGKDIDWDIVRSIIIPKILEKYKFTEFNKNKYGQVFARLKYFAESAKIELSQYAKTTIEIEEIGKDESGKEVLLSIPFSRDEFNKLIESKIDRTIELTKNTIKEAGFKNSSIKRIVLVGGTTLIPYIKEKLEDALSIKVDSSVDPLTVVAHGACVFAIGQKIPKEFLQEGAQKMKRGVHSINLNYTSLTADTEESVTGIIDDLDDKSEYFVQIQSESGTFTGPKTKLNKGKFFYTVKVQKNKQNLYWVYVFDNKSNPIKVSPDSFAITHGLSVSGAPIPHSIQILVATQLGNVPEKIFEREETLPLKKTLVYKTSRRLKKGEESFLGIEIQEGEGTRADRNDRIDVLKIPGKELPCDLPEGTPIELTAEMNESRELTVTAYIRLIDMSFSVRANLKEEEVNLESVSSELAVQRKRAESIFEYCSDGQRKQISDNLQAVSEGVNNSQMDEGEKRKTSKQLKELKIHLDGLEEEKKMPQLVKEYNARIEYLQKIINEYADQRQKEENNKQLENIKADGERAVKENNKDLLVRINEQLANLTSKALYSNPNMWIGAFRQIVQADNFTNEKEAQYYINKCTEAINSKDYEELKRCVVQLNLLRPVDQRKDIDLSGITR